LPQGAVVFSLLQTTLLVLVSATNYGGDNSIIKACSNERSHDVVRACSLIINGDGNREEIAFAYFARGRALSVEGRPADAISDLTKAIALNARFADAYSERGRAYAILGRIKEAIADTSEAIRIVPNN
jgi:tetratricopeptide (TPR) repeat protein